jgi:hypothetical protein
MSPNQTLSAQILSFGKKGQIDANLHHTPNVTLKSQDNNSEYRIVINKKTLLTRPVRYRAADA